jgi:hypothetical protein
MGDAISSQRGENARWGQLHALSDQVEPSRNKKAGAPCSEPAF